MTKRILFVEDNVQLQDLFADMLPLAMDVVLVKALTCAQGRVFLNTEHFDAVVLDGTLPDGKGPQLYTEFRDQLRASATPVIVHSAEDARDLRTKFPPLEQDQIPVLLKGRDDLDAALRQLLFP
jgi:DNA-binding response OmpR family regulator